MGVGDRTIMYHERIKGNQGRYYEHYPNAKEIEKDLALFHKTFFNKNNSFDSKLELIKEYSKKVYCSVTDETLQQRRDSFARYKDFKYKAKKETCKLCNKNKAECRHHIIPLKHGGFKSSTKRVENIILLCGSCHKLIHTWL